MTKCIEIDKKRVTLCLVTKIPIIINEKNYCKNLSHGTVMCRNTNLHIVYFK